MKVVRKEAQTWKSSYDTDYDGDDGIDDGDYNGDDVGGGDGDGDGNDIHLHPKWVHDDVLKTHCPSSNALLRGNVRAGNITIIVTTITTSIIITNYLKKDIYMGLLMAQYSVSSVIHGLLGPTPTSKGSQSMKVSVYLGIAKVILMIVMVLMIMMNGLWSVSI